MTPDYMGLAARLGFPKSRLARKVAPPKTPWI